MSTTTDTFVRFVDVLSVTPDDHDASGEALASRLHPSRFHFDRRVSAAAGEPPATLRRRVLLERAAYRLITTDDDVLDARVEISVDGIDCEPTLRSLLSRLVGQLAMWDAATHDQPYDFEVERSESVSDMRARLAESGPAFLAQVPAIIDEGRLDKTLSTRSALRRRSSLTVG